MRTDAGRNDAARPSGRIGVTGASGYIGGALTMRAKHDGSEVVALGRRAASGSAEWRVADLAQSPSDELLDGLDGVIHLAADTTGGNRIGAEAELAFARALATQARSRGIVCVFVSSQAASANAPSAYGRSKAAIEAALAELGAISIRPGLVIGGAEAGLFGMLCRLVRSVPLLPRLWPAPLVQPVHVDDLAAALLLAVAKPALCGRVLAVAGPALPFHQLLQKIARHRVRRRRFSVVIPVPLLHLSLRLARPFLGAGFAPERLDSLVGLPMLQADEHLAELGVCLRPLEAACERGGRGRRAWLEEANALTRGLLGVPAPAGMLRRYVRLLRARGVQHPLHLHELLLDHPSLLAALDTPSQRISSAVGSLQWRMSVVLRLAEAEPTLAEQFLLRSDASGSLGLLRSLFGVALLEASGRCQRPLARRLLRSAG